MHCFLKFSVILFWSFNYLATIAIASENNSSILQKQKESISHTSSLKTTTLEDDSYLLGPGDVLKLYFLGDEKLSGEIQILSDGTASIPFLGNVNLRWMTLNQASLKISNLLKNELLNPKVQIEILKTRPVRVSLVGEVQNPGVYSINSNKLSEANDLEANIGDGPPTLVDAIQTAGGITNQANLKQVLLRRRLPSVNNSQNYPFKRTTLNIYDLILRGEQINNPYLFDGDTITLLKVKQNNLDNIQITSNNLSRKKIEVNIIGEVNNPGNVLLNANTPLIQAIYYAGGIKNLKVSKTNIKLIRLNTNGTAFVKRYKLNLKKSASNEENPLLKDGDTVIVNPNAFAKASNAITTFTEPIGGLVNTFTLFRILNGND